MVISTVTDALEDIDVSNVFLYVGDAVRNDALTEEFTDRGTYVRTVASSTHSPASFASIVTGSYPPTHGVRSFSDKLPSELLRLFDISGFESRFLNSIFAYASRSHGQDMDPIHGLLNTRPPDVDSPFDGLKPPFVAMERGPGGHAPYGDSTGTAVQYFEERGGDQQSLKEDYERSIELDINWFDRRVQELADRELIEDTLVVYTSDHGELLGEHGLLGHNDPMYPELVYVPTIFIHPKLPNTRLTGTSFHHADLMPTLLTVLGLEANHDQFDGGAPPEAFSDDARPCFWQNDFLPTWVPGISGHLSYEGVWNSAGGWAFTETNLLERYGVLIGKLARSSKRSYMRRHLEDCIRAYWWDSNTFGTPSFDDSTARKVLKRAKQNSKVRSERQLSSEELEHLRDLGYLNR